MMPALALVLATAVSLLGTQLTLVALPWFVLQITGSAAQTGLTGSFLALPQFVAGLLGGAVVDRVGYRRVSITADIVSCLAVGAIPLLYATVGLAFWQLLALVFVGGLLAIPGLTARRAMLPELAAAARLTLDRMSAAFEGCTYLALLLGPAVAGVLVSIYGPANVLFVDAASFAFSAVVIGAWARVRFAADEPGARGAPGQPRRGGVLGGLGYLRRDRLLLTLALQLAITNFLSGPLFAVVLPFYVRDVYRSAATLGLLLACQGAGLVLGALGYGLVGPRFARRHLWLAGYMSFPLTYAALGLGLPLPAIAATYAVVGFLGGPINPLLVTVRYERIPLELRGRVFGTFSAITQVAQPLGMAAAGLAVDVVGLTPTVDVLAVAGEAVGLSLLLLPVLREMDAGRGQPSRGVLRP